MSSPISSAPSSPSTAPSSPPLLTSFHDERCFPLELFLEILSHADTQTLGRLARCCLDLYELAIPFIYEDVYYWVLPEIRNPRPRRINFLERLAYNAIRSLRVNLESSQLFYRYDLPDLPNLRHIHFFAPAHHRSSFDNDCVRFFPLDKFADVLSSVNPKSISFHLYDRSSSLRWRLEDKEFRDATKGWDRLESVTFSGGWLSCVDRKGKDTALFWPSQSLLRMTYDFRLRPQKGLLSLKELLPEESTQALREKDSRVVVLVSPIAARDGLLDTPAGLEDDEKEKYNGSVRVRAKGSGEDLHRNWEQLNAEPSPLDVPTSEPLAWAEDATGARWQEVSCNVWKKYNAYNVALYAAHGHEGGVEVAY